MIAVTNVAVINAAVIDPTDSTDVQAVLVYLLRDPDERKTDDILISY